MNERKKIADLLLNVNKKIIFYRLSAPLAPPPPHIIEAVIVESIEKKICRKITVDNNEHKYKTKIEFSKDIDELLKTLISDDNYKIFAGSFL